MMSLLTMLIVSLLIPITTLANNATLPRITASPDPHPAANLTVLQPTATATIPPPLIASDSKPTGKLVVRCGNGDCSFGGTAQTLSAAVVTTTILSVTSVPCYTTEFVTNSQTITSTIYSTDTITSTVTEEGTVYIIQYAPTPILMSSVYESTIALVETLTSFWTGQSGSAYETTYTSGFATISGNGGQGGSGGSPNTPEPAPVATPTTTSTADAWTHESAGSESDTAEGALAGAGAVTVTANNGVNGAANDAAKGGWTTANAGSAEESNAVAAAVNWNAASPRVGSNEPYFLVVVFAVATIIFWEVCHFVS
ncbi:hypothetical protein BCR39DRAFT_179195 [Naematelia encephala]|uniref:Uncharacterized protein n=1 Tax=Naematelia encephala TaxID=71784 RepID=A0A1Y2B2W1_9TREE|nr:hypothetical protein BCR39DRAFT_179195 [Naematelia encephala]